MKAVALSLLLPLLAITGARADRAATLPRDVEWQCESMKPNDVAVCRTQADEMMLCIQMQCSRIDYPRAESEYLKFIKRLYGYKEGD